MHDGRDIFTESPELIDAKKCIFVCEKHQLMSLQNILYQHVKTAFNSLYQTDIERVEFQSTRKDFEGDITIVTFPMLRAVKMNPVQLGEDLGAFLSEHLDEVVSYNVVKGFLNLVLSRSRCS